jgi:hypothetical protein
VLIGVTGSSFEAEAGMSKLVRETATRGVEELAAVVTAS